MKLHNADHLGHLIGGGASDIREFPYREKKKLLWIWIFAGSEFCSSSEFPLQKNSGGWEVRLQTIHSGQNQKFRDGEFLWEFGIMKADQPELNGCIGL